MLVVMAGLPGTGKSALAGRLAGELSGVVLSKDTVRAALFPRPVLDYSAEQDEIAMGAVYAAAGYVLAGDPGRVVILDGRTFSKAAQVGTVATFAESVGQSARVIECVCTDDVARGRLKADAATGTHPAGNRTVELYQRVKARAEPLTVPRLTLDTGALSLDECVRRAREYLL